MGSIASLRWPLAHSLGRNGRPACGAPVLLFLSGCFCCPQVKAPNTQPVGPRASECRPCRARIRLYSRRGGNHNTLASVEAPRYKDSGWCRDAGKVDRNRLATSTKVGRVAGTCQSSLQKYKSTPRVWASVFPTIRSKSDAGARRPAGGSADRHPLAHQRISAAPRGPAGSSIPRIRRC